MKFFIMICVVLCGSLGAKIVEVSNFEEILNHITPDSTILCDIDDTLLIPSQMVGSDEWFCAMLQRYKEEGLSPKEALQKSLDRWEMVRHVTEMQLVEPVTASIIQQMQENGLCVMGLTTQGFSLERRTVWQLEGNGVLLHKTAPSEDDVYFTRDSKGEKQGVLFRKGILFTGGAHKGESFFTLCEKVGHDPKHIVFINDKGTHLAEIKESANKRGIDFVGLRYAYSDATKARFDMEIAEAQFARIPYKKIISDEEATEHLLLVR